MIGQFNIPKILDIGYIWISSSQKLIRLYMLGCIVYISIMRWGLLGASRGIPLASWPLDKSRLTMKTSSMPIQNMHFFFIPHPIKCSSNSFQLTLCGCQEEQPCKTTSYHCLLNSHITIYIRVVPLQTPYVCNGPNWTPKTFQGLRDFQSWRKAIS